MLPGGMRGMKHLREKPIAVFGVRATLVVLALSTLWSSSARAQGWYSSSWPYRKQITIDFTKVGATGAPHANLPVLVSLSADANLSANARADGFDIVFTSSDGTTKLNHERTSYASGTLLAWVQVPSVSATANTVIYMYYGNASAADQQNGTGTWDANYVGVWHLNETVGGAGAIKDATSNAKHGTTNGTMTLGGSDRQRHRLYQRLGGLRHVDHLQFRQWSLYRGTLGEGRRRQPIPVFEGHLSWRNFLWIPLAKCRHIPDLGREQDYRSL